jgi:phosphatidylglycerophosphate synthase
MAWRDIANIYRMSKKKQDINWFTEWVCRPPAALVVYALASTPVTPNQLTFASFAIAAGSAVMLMTLPGYGWLLAAMAIYELSFILDCADGQLARYRKTPSVLGHLLDFMMDEIKAMLVFGAVTVRLYRDTGDPDLLLLGIAGLFALSTGLTMTSFMRRPEYGAKGPTEDGQPAEIKQRTGVAGRGLSLVEHAARTVVHYPQYIWICALFERLDIYFWGYGAVQVLYVGRTGLAILWRLGRS